jgi:hypothetical protein
MDDATDPRLLDVAAPEFIKVSCPCGRIIEYAPGVLQRLRRIGSDGLVYDFAISPALSALQPPFRLPYCRRRLSRAR